MIIDIGKTGLNTDVAPTKLPPDAVTGGENFLCTEGSVRAPTMRLKVMDLSIEPRFRFVWTTKDNEDKLVISDGESIMLYDADGTETDITPSTSLTAGCQVTFADLGTLLIVNSNKDKPWFYDEAATELKPLQGWGNWKCEVMTSVRYNLVALNMTEDGVKMPQKVRWSSSAEEGAIPAVWDPTDLAYDAGDDILGETSGHIIGGAVFRDSLWIGKTDAIYEMRYLGGQFVYSIIRRTGDLGISRPDAICAAKNVLAIVSRDDLYKFDGSTAMSMTDNRIHNLVLELSKDGSFAYEDLTYSPNQDFLFATLAGEGATADKVLVYSFADDTWNVLTFGDVYGFDLAQITADTDPELICYRKNVDGGYQVEQFSSVYDPDLEAEYLFVDGSVERTGIPLGAPMMVEKVLPVLRGTDALQPLKISIGVQASQDQEIRWTPEYEIDAKLKRFIPVRKVGRFLCWRVQTRAKKPWYLDALDVRVFPAGDKD